MQFSRFTYETPSDLPVTQKELPNIQCAQAYWEST